MIQLIEEFLCKGRMKTLTCFEFFKQFATAFDLTAFQVGQRKKPLRLLFYYIVVTFLQIFKYFFRTGNIVYVEVTITQKEQQVVFLIGVSDSKDLGDLT